jgi:hypothetical protein
MSGDDALRGNAADGDHGKSSIEQFRIDLGLVLFRITGLELMPAKVCLFSKYMMLNISKSLLERMDMARAFDKDSHSSHRTSPPFDKNVITYHRVHAFLGGPPGPLGRSRPGPTSR